MSRHLRLLDAALEALGRSAFKTLAVLLVYALLVFLATSLLLLVASLRLESEALLAEAPTIVVQRLRGGRHELIETERTAAIAALRGVFGVVPRVWGYTFDPPTGATFTLWGADSVPAGSLEVQEGVLGAEPRTCVVGQGVAEVRFLDVGDRLPIKRFDGELHAPRVVGVFKTSSALLTNDLVVLPTAELRQVFGIAEDLATDLAVTVRNPREVDTVAQKVRELWPDVRVLTRRQMLSTWQAAFDWRGGLWASMLFAVVLAFGVLVWDKASGLTAEEYRTLGVLKAVGWTPRDVLELELLKGAAVSALAVLLGVVAAEVHLRYFSGALFAPLLKGWSVVFPTFELTAPIDGGILATVVLLAVLPYVAASLLPAWRAAVSDPDSVLRS